VLKFLKLTNTSSSGVRSSKKYRMIVAKNKNMVPKKKMMAKILGCTPTPNLTKW
jgi:hypothetical protein